jgi:hypothetical protein
LVSVSDLTSSLLGLLQPSKTLPNPAASLCP